MIPASSLVTGSAGPSVVQKTRLTLSGAITLGSIFIIIMVQLAAAVFATDWAVATLLGFPFWASMILTFLSAIPVLYAGWLVGKLAYKAECELVV